MTSPSSSDPNAPPLRIAILGGGIVGLTLCAALQHLSSASPSPPSSDSPSNTRLTYTLYESASKFSEIGAGIMIGWNALRALGRLGLGEEYERVARGSWLENVGRPSADQGQAGEVGEEAEDGDEEALADADQVIAGGEWEDASASKRGVFFQYRFVEGRNGGEPFCTITSPGGQTNTHRAELLDLLLKHIPLERVKFRKTLVGYEVLPGGAIELQFGDGTREECDVLLGADGIKSTIRRLMYAKAGRPKEEQEPRYSRSYGYRSLVPTHLMLGAVGREITATPTMWLDHQRHVVHYPVAAGRWINVVAFRSDYSKGRHPEWTGKPEWVEHGVDEREMMEDYEGCGEQVRAILSLVQRPSRWAMFDVPDLPFFVQGNVAILGDAAHGMTPHMGNGASQGIEDAHLLAHLLTHPSVNAQTVSAALKAYELVRKERVQRIKELSYEIGRLWELSSPVGEDTVEFDRVAKGTMNWVWDVDVGKQVQNAVGWFEMSLQDKL